MKKILDIPDDLIRSLKVIAAMEDKSVKAYLQDLIIADVKEKAKKIKK